VDLTPTGDLIRDTAVTPAAEGRYRGVVRDGYGAGASVPNGGLLLSIATRAMAQTAQRPSVLTVTGHYLRRAQPGSAAVDVDVLRKGRMVMARARLTQNDGPALHATGVFADRALLPRRTLVHRSPPDLPEPAACLSNADLSGDPNVAAHPVFQRLEHRVPRDQLHFATGGSGSRAEIAGWYRPLVGQCDEPAVPFLMDALYPPIFAIGLLAFAPTIEFTVQIRRPPGDGWLRYRFATRAITGGVMEEDGELWSADGELIALSRQTALPSD
jgi:acyl-CoA thioesterase